jgi:hypothetical protein
MSCESTHPNNPTDIEYQSENKLTARHAVEEAMTSAFVRECNKCHRPFVKEEGCNKMRCSCGNAQCFVCSLDVTDYNHFDRKDASGNLLPDSCPLYEDTTARLRREVAAAQKRAVHQIREDRPDLTEDDVIVDKKIVVPGEAAVTPLVPLVPAAPLQQNNHGIYAPFPIPFGIERPNVFPPPPAPLPRAIDVELDWRRLGGQQMGQLFAAAVRRRRNDERRDREAREARQLHEAVAMAQVREDEVIRREEAAEMERQAAQQRELEALARLREREERAHELEVARMQRAHQELERRMQEEQAEAVRIVEEQERQRREREQNAQLEQQAQNMMDQARRKYVEKHNSANNAAKVTEQQIIKAMTFEQQVIQRAAQSRKRAEEVLKKAKKEPKQRRKEAELRAQHLATEITERYNQERRDAERQRDEAIDRARLAGVKVGKYEKQVLESNRKSKSFWKW